MEHFWKTIPGFFTFPQFYSWLAETLVVRTPPGKFIRGVEVGVYAGQSVAFLAVEFMNILEQLPYSEHPSYVQIDMVDTFDGDVNTVLNALKPVEDLIGTAHVGKSWDMAARYADASLDWVFIDADHAYESVRKDIDAWLPKIKPGGIICGHDYTVWPGFGVIQAVTETFDHIEVWRGEKHMGDAQMDPHYWPVWSVQL